jgi:CRISPR system Cascade subunit CasA
MPPHPMFNLLDEPWIPVEWIAGGVTEVGLQRVFDDAAKIRRILDPSPLVTVGIYRLLFAIYHRANPMRSSNDWVDAWQANTAHLTVTAYLERWRERFELFHPTTPFWQVPDLNTAVGTMPWTKLATERNVNNSKVWFDHTITVRDPTPITSAYAARLLIAAQVASVGAGKSGTGYNVNAPVATALMVVPEGRNLAETLLANVRTGKGSATDSAIWEREPIRVQQILSESESKAPGRTFDGIADRLTWLTRAILFVPPDESGVVREIHFGAGLRYATIPDDRDPWVPYRTTKEGEWIPRRWPMEHALWRDLHTLVVNREQVSTVPLVVNDIETLRDSDRLPPLWSLLVAGQSADKAKIEGWGLERWSVPHDLITNSFAVVGALQAAVAIADEVSAQLQRLAFTLARDLLANGRQRRTSDVGDAARQLPLAAVTWSRLERPYALFLQHLVQSSDVNRAEALERWRAEVATAIEAGASATHAAIGRDARAVRAWALFTPKIEHLARKVRAPMGQIPRNMEANRG